MRRKPQTWLELFVARVGIRRAARVLAFVGTYGATQKELERAPTMDEYADAWGVSRATAYRDLALFREAQPFFEEPAGLIAHMGTDMSAIIPARFRGELA